MLGSAIPKRWLVSLALVGLVSLFMASFASVWVDPASAATTTTSGSPTPVPTSTPAPAGSVLTKLVVSSALNVQPGQVVGISAVPVDDQDNVDINMPGVTYTWVSGSCGTLNSTTSRTPEFTAIDNACSGTISVHANQGSGSNVPSGGASITVNVSAPPATPVPTPVLTTADDGDVDGQSVIDSKLLEAISAGKFYEGAGAGGVVPSKSANVADSTGNGVSISAGSLDSGDSKVVVVSPVKLVDLQAPPPPQTSGSKSGTFKFGSSAIQIDFYAGDTGVLGDKANVRLNKPARVCMSYTPADLQGAYGGPDGMNIWHYDGTAWVKLSTTVLTNPDRVCAWTSSFSPFALGLDVEPPDAGSAGTVLPVTGGYSPDAMTMILAMFAGFALVGTGVVAARRARRAGENS